MKNNKKISTDKEGARPAGAKPLLPSLKKEVSFMLNSEEAKISTRGIIAGAVTVFSLGVAADALGGYHTNSHNSTAPHTSLNPHDNVNAGHSSFAPHNDAYPHVNVAPHNDFGTPHTNTHASINEAVTKGTLHNNSTDGYGKHTASIAHNNAPQAHNNSAGHSSDAPHYSYNAHASTAPHMNVGHHMNMAPHYSVAPHNNGHGSHGSHGQW